MDMKAAFAAGLLRVLVTVLVLALAFSGALSAAEPVAVKIRDLTSIEGVRENPLIGYGMVVGLTRTGDSSRPCSRPRLWPTSCSAWARRFRRRRRASTRGIGIVTASLPHSRGPACKWT